MNSASRSAHLPQLQENESPIDKLQNKVSTTYQKLSTIIDFETKDITTTSYHHKRCNNAGCNNQVFGRLCEECQTDEIINDLINPNTTKPHPHNIIRDEHKRNHNPTILNFDNLIDHGSSTIDFNTIDNFHHEFNEITARNSIIQYDYDKRLPKRITSRPIILSNQLVTERDSIIQLSTADLEAKLNDWEMELKKCGVKVPQKSNDDLSSGISTILDYENEITACKVELNQRVNDTSEIIEALDLSGGHKLNDFKNFPHIKRHFSTEDQKLSASDSILNSKQFKSVDNVGQTSQASQAVNEKLKLEIENPNAESIKLKFDSLGAKDFSKSSEARVVLERYDEKLCRKFAANDNEKLIECTDSESELPYQSKKTCPSIMAPKNDKNRHRDSRKVKNSNYKVSLGSSSSKILITLKTDNSEKLKKSSKKDKHSDTDSEYRKSRKKKKRRKRSRERRHYEIDNDTNKSQDGEQGERPPVRILIKLPKLNKPITSDNSEGQITEDENQPEEEHADTFDVDPLDVEAESKIPAIEDVHKSETNYSISEIQQDLESVLNSFQINKVSTEDEESNLSAEEIEDLSTSTLKSFSNSCSDIKSLESTLETKTIENNASGKFQTFLNSKFYPESLR